MGHRGTRQAEEHAGAGAGTAACCPYYHQAIELIGKRWTGAIVGVLLNGSSADQGAGLRFCEIAQAVPELSDRLLSERMKELEARGVVERTVHSGPPVRVEYRLTEMGRELEPALTQLRGWARRWLGEERDAAAPAPSSSLAGAATR
ncbi:MAG: MarR family transcriptional regulator [Pseudonocardiales bacterium]|nr:MAG: MarR family transcriptional regulator [Pseudonocardiales bacterium]